MKKWHLAIVVALVIGLATGVYALGPGHGRVRGGACGSPGPGFGSHEAGLGRLANLDLTKDQMDQLWQMREKHHADTQALRYETFRKRFELRKLCADPKADEAAVIAKQRELNAAQQKLHEKKIQLMFAQKKILTPEQINKLNEAPMGPTHGPRRPGGRGFGPGAGPGPEQG